MYIALISSGSRFTTEKFCTKNNLTIVIRWALIAELPGFRISRFPILGGEKYLKWFFRVLNALQEQKPSKNRTIRSQNLRSFFDLVFRSHKMSIQKYPAHAKSSMDLGQISIQKLNETGEKVTITKQIGHVSL